MSTWDTLRRRQTRQLNALVRKVTTARRLSKYVPTAEMLLAAAAKAIIIERRRKRR